MDTQALSALGLTPADTVQGKMPEAVWPGRGDDGMLYPGCLGFIAGPSGVSKSLATNKVMADWTRTRGYVIVNDGEDGGAEGMSRMRLEAAGADLAKVIFGEFYLPRDTERLEAAIETLGGPVLVVWDTAESFIEAPAQRWGKALAPLSNGVLPRTQAVGMLVHHTLKNARKGADWRSAVGGATAGLVGKSRFGFLYGVRPDDATQRIMVMVKDQYRDVKENGAFNRSVAFEFDAEDMDDGSGQLRPVSYLRITDKKVAVANPTEIVFVGADGSGAARGPSPEKAAEAAEWITRQLADGARPVSDIALCLTHPGGNPLASGECGALQFGKVSGGCPYCGGPTKMVQGLKESCEQDGLSWGGAVRKALVALGCESDRKGSKDAASGIVFSWRLPAGHPARNTPYAEVLK